MHAAQHGLICTYFPPGLRTLNNFSSGSRHLNTSSLSTLDSISFDIGHGPCTSSSLAMPMFHFNHDLQTTHQGKVRQPTSPCGALNLSSLSSFFAARFFIFASIFSSITVHAKASWSSPDRHVSSMTHPRTNSSHQLSSCVFGSAAQLLPLLNSFRFRHLRALILDLAFDLAFVFARTDSIYILNTRSNFVPVHAFHSRTLIQLRHLSHVQYYLFGLFLDSSKRRHPNYIPLWTFFYLSPCQPLCSCAWSWSGKVGIIRVIVNCVLWSSSPTSHRNQQTHTHTSSHRQTTSLLPKLHEKQLISSGGTEMLEKTFSGVPAKVLTRIIQNKKSGKLSRESYDHVLQSFALTLNFYSAKAYQYVRKTFDCALPHPATIRKWYRGINVDVSQLLEISQIQGPQNIFVSGVRGVFSLHLCRL